MENILLILYFYLLLYNYIIDKPIKLIMLADILHLYLNFNLYFL